MSGLRKRHIGRIHYIGNNTFLSRAGRKFITKRSGSKLSKTYFYTIKTGRILKNKNFINSKADVFIFSFNIRKFIVRIRLLIIGELSLNTKFFEREIMMNNFVNFR